MLEKHSVVFITGATGMVGSALATLLEGSSFDNVLKPNRKELDLRNQSQVDFYFDEHHPDYVFMIGAKVGGIAANQADPVGFLSDNAHMQLNLFEACYKYGTRKNLFLGSSCIYPRDCPQPMQEDYLLTGKLEQTNEGYALAKIMGLKLAKYYYEQYGMLTICPVPCNIYGTNDSFDLERSHVLSALVRRFVDAKEANLPHVTLWGTGSSRREFIHVKDVADALLFLMEYCETPEIINVGTGKDISIYNLARSIALEAGYNGGICWDNSKPDGMPRKCLDISLLMNMGFKSKICLQDGIKQTIIEYRQIKAKGLLS